MALAGVAVSAAQSVTGFMAASADYKNQAAAWKENYRNSLTAGREEQTSIQTRAAQEQEAAAQKLYLSHLEEAQKTAEAKVSAAEAGVAGISVDNIVNDLTRSAALNRTTIRTNAHMTVTQLGQEMKATNTRIKNRINSMQKPTPPSGAALAINLAGAAIGGMRQ